MALPTCLGQLCPELFVERPKARLVIFTARNPSHAGMRFMHLRSPLFGGVTVLIGLKFLACQQTFDIAVNSGAVSVTVLEEHGA